MELQSAINQVINTYGKDVLLKDNFVNILDDLHAFENTTAPKYILRSAIKEGYLVKMTTYSKWNVACSAFVKKLVTKYGYDKQRVDEVLRFVACSIGIMKDPISIQNTASAKVDYEDLKEILEKATMGDIDSVKYCAKHHIDPFNCDVNFFNDYSQVKIGDWMYEDGSFTHNKSDLKKIVGVVFSLSPTLPEIQAGWRTGRVVAYKDSEPCEWDSKFVDLPFPHTHYTQSDIDNYKNTIQFKRYDTELLLCSSELPPFKSAQKVKIKLPKNKTSGWFLPDINSLLDVSKNLTTPLLNQLSLITKYMYWSASQFDANVALCIAFSADNYVHVENTHDKTSYCRIRPILAF